MVGPVRPRIASTLSALLRSWEDRYAAYPVQIGFDTLTIAVLRPPTDEEQAVLLSEEHFAFCQAFYNAGGQVHTHAEHIVGARDWYFYWD